MPTYEYLCEPCKTIYKTVHGMNETPEHRCPACDEPIARMVSAPNLSLGGWSSPTEARYAKLSHTDEIAREKTLQREYLKVWLPTEVKHSPWHDDH